MVRWVSHSRLCSFGKGAEPAVGPAAVTMIAVTMIAVKVVIEKISLPVNHFIAAYVYCLAV